MRSNLIIQKIFLQISQKMLRKFVQNLIKKLLLCAQMLDNFHTQPNLRFEMNFVLIIQEFINRSLAMLLLLLKKLNFMITVWFPVYNLLSLSRKIQRFLYHMIRKQLKSVSLETFKFIGPVNMQLLTTIFITLLKEV